MIGVGRFAHRKKIEILSEAGSIPAGCDGLSRLNGVKSSRSRYEFTAYLIKRILDQTHRVVTASIP